MERSLSAVMYSFAPLMNAAAAALEIALGQPGLAAPLVQRREIRSAAALGEQILQARGGRGVERILLQRLPVQGGGAVQIVQAGGGELRGGDEGLHGAAGIAAGAGLGLQGGAGRGDVALLELHAARALSAGRHCGWASSAAR